MGIMLLLRAPSRSYLLDRALIWINAPSQIAQIISSSPIRHGRPKPLEPRNIVWLLLAPYSALVRQIVAAGIRARLGTRMIRRALIRD
jgi:hypothetical protein